MRKENIAKKIPCGAGDLCLQHKGKWGIKLCLWMRFFIRIFESFY
jgi:hypothetical protein